MFNEESEEESDTEPHSIAAMQQNVEKDFKQQPHLFSNQPYDERKQSAFFGKRDSEQTKFKELGRSVLTEADPDQES